MAYIFKTIAATQFLSNMFFIYFLWTVTYWSFTLVAQCTSEYNGYFIATFSENVKNHKYLKICKRKSDFEWIFDPQGSTRVSYARGKNFIFGVRFGF